MKPTIHFPIVHDAQFLMKLYVCQSPTSSGGHFAPLKRKLVGQFVLSRLKSSWIESVQVGAKSVLVVAVPLAWPATEMALAEVESQQIKLVQLAAATCVSIWVFARLFVEISGHQSQQSAAGIAF